MSASELFESFEDEYGNFSAVENKLSSRPDLHSFIMLNNLFPNNRDMVCCAEHDEIWLDVCEEQIETLTSDQILELYRCGVRYDDESGSLALFV